MEQPDVPSEAKIPMLPPPRPLSDEVRASLEAVRLAQEAARLRGRKQTMRTRIWFATLVGAVTLIAVAFAPRIARRPKARPQAATAALPAPLPALPEPVAPAATAELMDTSAAEPGPVAAEAQPQTEAKTRAFAPDEGCDTALIRRAPWRLSRDACARAFESDSSNSALALAIAHAEHAHGSPAGAAQWAKRALALDPNAAEAYVLIARAEMKNGRHEDARTAYKHYLGLAPRGWHQTEARAALRRP